MNTTQQSWQPRQAPDINPTQQPPQAPAPPRPHSVVCRVGNLHV